MDRQISRSSTESKSFTEKTICKHTPLILGSIPMDFMPSFPHFPPSSPAPAKISPMDEETMISLKKVQSIICYSFRDPSLLEEALTHPSCLSNASYQRLEFVGDSVLHLAFTNFVFLTNPSVGPGVLSTLRSANISTEKLARVAIRHNFYRYLRRNSPELDLKVKEFAEAVGKETEDYHELSYGGSTVKAPKVLADIVESIAAAIYVDCSFNLVELWKVFRGILEPIITAETPNQQPVSQLYELCHKQGTNPVFKNWRKNNVDITNVYIDGELYGVGSSEQKHIARLNAARSALQKLCHEEDDDMEIVNYPLSTSGTCEDHTTSISTFNANGSEEQEGSKHRLHQLCLKNHWPKPVYNIEEKQGPAHGLRFLCSVTVVTNNNRVCAYGDPKSRLRDGDNSAAYKLLCKLDNS